MSNALPPPSEPEAAATGGETSRFRRLAGHASWFMLAQVISLFAGFWTIRIVDPATYGAFVAIVAAFGVVAQWFGFRSWEATVKYLAQFLAAGDQRRLVVVLRLGYLMDAVSYGLTWIALVLAGRWLAGTVLHEPGLAHLVAIYGLTGIGLIPYATANAALRALGRFRVIFFCETSASLLRLVGVLLVALLPESRRLTGLIWVNVAGYAWQGLGTWWQARRALGPLPAVPWSRALWDEFAGYRRGLGNTLLNSNLIAWMRPLYRGLDLILITHWLGPIAGGLFGIARKVSDLVGLVAPGVQAALGPELSRLAGLRRYREAGRLAVRSGLLLFALTAALAIAIGLLVSPLLRWWQPEYMLAVGPTRWLLVAGVIFSVTAPFYTFLVSSHRPQLATASFAVTAVAQMVALLALRQFTGGLAIAPATNLLALAIVFAAVCSLTAYTLCLLRIVRTGVDGEPAEAAP